jgi:hypothetical protein
MKHPIPKYRFLLAYWSALGFYRGVNSYKYENETYTKRYAKPVRYLYSATLLYGITGSVIYLFPVLLPITIAKEIYRIEVNLRGLNDDKKTRYYNELL